MSSADEAEICVTSNNEKTAIGMWPALILLDLRQPATLLKTDNSTTEVFVNLKMKLKRSKIWDMKWHWFRDKEVLEKLRIYWDKGMNNDADYFIKHHPPIQNCQILPRYIHTSSLVRKIPQTTRLCKGVLNQVLGTQSHVKYLKAI